MTQDHEKRIRATSLADKYITKDDKPRLMVVTDAATPLDQVEEYIRRFVVYPNEHAVVAHALWIAHTHLMDCWDTTPRLAFMSTSPGSGKTRALEVSELLALSPRMSASMSAAALVRIIATARKEDRYETILFDEIDGVFSKSDESIADLRSALNSGYRRNGKFTRCVQKGAATEDLPSYAALAVAGLKKLPDALSQRAIYINMKPRANDEPKEDFRLRDQPAQAGPIYIALTEWCERKRTSVSNYRPELPAAIRDRSADIWEPLIIIADLAGGDWPKRGRAAATFLTGAAKDVTVKGGSDIELLLHGGKSPGAPKGNRNAWKHGLYSAEAIALRRVIRRLLSDAADLVERC